MNRAEMIPTAVSYKTGKREPIDRIIMDAGPDEEVVHVDGDPLNCCRENLRLVKIVRPK